MKEVGLDHIEVEDKEFEKQMGRKRLWNEYTIAEREQIAGSNALSREWTKFNRAIQQELIRLRRR